MLKRETENGAATDWSFLVSRLPFSDSDILHRMDEPFEEHIRVMGPGGGLGMKLRRQDWQCAMAEPFERAVVQVAVGLLDLGAEGFPIDRETVILRRNRDLAGSQVAHRMVRSAVTELQLEGFSSQGEAEQLMAEADPENRPRADQLLQRMDRARQRGRIPGAIGEEDPVRLESEDLFRRGARRKNR